MKPIVQVRGVSKRYRIGAHRARYASLRESLTEWARQPFQALLKKGGQQRPTIWALKNVTFDVMPGEVVGIIGRNGAGKSTLLKVLSRITEPTEGEIDLFGRVGSLLDVGTGFHPELTGRENIFLNGAILGMKRAEIDHKFDEIVAFSEIDQLIDTPVKHYSSGMYVRLAFAVAAHLEPEILLVDEVLAVGDVQFQKKCLGKMGDIAQGGRMVLVVSHNMGVIRTLCTRAIVLDAGELIHDGDADDGVRLYSERPEPGTTQIAAHFRTNEQTISVTSCEVNGSTSDVLHLGSDDHEITIRLKGVASRPSTVDVEARLSDELGSTLAYFSPGHVRGGAHRVPEGPFTIFAVMQLPRLNEGRFNLSMRLTHPGITIWADADPAVLLVADGQPLATGQILRMKQVGWALLEGHSEVEAG